MARRWLWSFLFVSVLALPGCGDDADVQQELADRAAEIGVSAELIRVVDLPDHQPAWQSVGVYGAQGFVTAYTSSGGDVAMLVVEPGEMTRSTCAERPIVGVSGTLDEPVDCTSEGDGWYRAGAGHHEFTLAQDGNLVSVSAPTGAVDAETLRQAVEGARAPDAGELEELFPAEHRPPERTPVERGDLPPHGDGAPQNPDGTGREG